MSDEAKWIPPGMRACTWDEAQRMSEDESLRMGMHGEDRVPHPYPHPSAFPPATKRTTWLCIDTPKPQHTPDPWREHGFERCTAEEAPVGPNENRVSWSVHDGILLRPSAEKGLREAVEWLRDCRDCEEAANELEAHVNKRYPPPVCGECGRARP
jgi:hypothetical protein